MELSEIDKDKSRSYSEKLEKWEIEEAEESKKIEELVKEEKVEIGGKY